MDKIIRRYIKVYYYRALFCFVTTEFNSGVSESENAASAAKDALYNAHSRQADLSEIDFVTVFISPEYEYQTAVETIRSETNNATLIGSSSSGEFTSDESISKGIAVSTVKSDDMEFSVGIGTGVSDDPEQAVAEATEKFPDDFKSEYTVGLNFHDGLAGRGDELTLHAYSEYPMPYVGGAASDEYQLESTVVFANDTVKTDAIAIGVIGNNSGFGIGVSHGHKKLSDGHRVTEASGSIVKTVDNRPTYEVWKDAVRDHADQNFGIDVDTIEPGTYEFARLLTIYSLGIETGDNKYKVRPGALTESVEDGSLRFATNIPEGTELFVMTSTKDDQRQAQQDAVASAVDNLDGSPAGGFNFSCTCQADILEEDFNDGIKSAGKQLGKQLVGAQMYGEIALEKGDMRGYHNATSSVLVIPE